MNQQHDWVESYAVYSSLKTATGCYPRLDIFLVNAQTSALRFGEDLRYNLQEPFSFMNAQISADSETSCYSSSFVDYSPYVACIHRPT